MELGRTPRLDEIRSRLEKAGQAHLLRFFDELEAEHQRSLLAQIADLDLDGLPALVRKYVRNKESFTLPSDLQPAPYYAADGRVVGVPGVTTWDRAAMKARGEALLREGKVAAFTVAGGQGTRLGFDGPKGAYIGTAITAKPLFQCLAEWILAARQRSMRTIPWYIMTSPLNHEQTVGFFKNHGYFGLSENDVMFFSQGVLPSLDMTTGNLMLANKWEVATNPDGHGGSLRALYTSGAIEDMRRRAVEHISYVQIDNPLARVIDPVFLGLHVAAKDSSGEMSSKMVMKTEPAEKVGLFCKGDGKVQVVEYSDMPADRVQQRDGGASSGGLRYCAGSIAIHIIGVEFVARLNEGGRLNLPLHRAEKKVPYIDLDSGKPVQPASPNAVKLEAFVFDALPLCRSSIVLETLREEEFAPIKNADGNDSPATCRDIQTRRAARWLEQHGVKIPRDPTGKPLCTLELSPLTAMDPEDLARAKLPRAIELGAELAI